MNQMLHIAANSTRVYDGIGKSADSKGGHLFSKRQPYHETTVTSSACGGRFVLRVQ
jgi:hypothetical protein